jgi:hypothetical protein
VQTEDGAKRIEDITPGDTVISADPVSAEQKQAAQPRLVTRTFSRDASTILDIHVGGEIIRATPEHPFWVVGAGWTAAGELRQGSALLTKDGIVIHVDRVERREGKFKVYNLEVDTVHTYQVSRLGILVHNKCGPLDKALGKNYPTKPNRAGKQQPYDPDSGHYLPYSANPGLARSPAVGFAGGLAQGYAAAISGADLPPAISPMHGYGQIIGQILGNLIR